MKMRAMTLAMLVLLLLAFGARMTLGQTGITGGKGQGDAKTESINALFIQAQNALNEKKWQEAVGLFQQLIAADPNRWDFLQGLGNAQLNLGQYEDAGRSYEKGIQVAEKVLSSSAPKSLQNPDSDPAKVKIGIGQMLTQQGNAYIKLRKNKEAVAAYGKAAELSPNPAIAYFNICATLYNMGNIEDAEAACDKAIAADPNKADTYFIKGSVMFAKGKLDANNKFVVSVGTADVLKKYLELSPDGPHANDVKQMLEMMGAKIETKNKSGK